MMKSFPKFFVATTLLSGLTGTAAFAQQPAELVGSNTGKSASLEVNGTVGLVDAGWEPAGAELWRRISDDGLVETLSFGRTGLERAKSRLDRQIVDLVRGKNLSAEDELRLHALQVRRDSLQQVEVTLPTKIDLETVEPVCYGLANFRHRYYRQDFATPAALADTFYSGEPIPGYKIAYAEAEVCAGGLCDFGQDVDTDNAAATQLHAVATAFRSPTFTCTMEAYSYVYASVSSYRCPPGSRMFVNYETSLSCSQL